MPIMVDAFDEEGRIVVWNRECELVTGYSAEEITNHPNPMQLLYPNADYLTPRLAEWETQGDNFRNWEWELIAKDGSVKTIAWSNISAQFPLSGWKAWGIGVDVTSRKAAERALYQTEEHLRMVISSAPVVLWAINKDGIYTMSEGKALDEIGYEPDEVVGQSVFEVNGDLPDVLDNVRRALSGESFIAAVEYNRGVKFETHYIPV
jgi:PAS domain S-box-containing protein